MLYEFFSGDPKLLAAVVDNLVLVRVTVDGVGAGWGMEEIEEEVGNWYLCEKRYSRCGWA